MNWDELKDRVCSIYNYVGDSAYARLDVTTGELLHQLVGRRKYLKNKNVYIPSPVYYMYSYSIDI